MRSDLHWNALKRRDLLLRVKRFDWQNWAKADLKFQRQKIFMIRKDLDQRGLCLTIHLLGLADHIRVVDSRKIFWLTKYLWPQNNRRDINRNSFDSRWDGTTIWRWNTSCVSCIGKSYSDDRLVHVICMLQRQEFESQDDDSKVA